jgi:hypothetical protein
MLVNPSAGFGRVPSEAGRPKIDEIRDNWNEPTGMPAQDPPKPSLEGAPASKKRPKAMVVPGLIRYDAARLTQR